MHWDQKCWIHINSHQNNGISSEISPIYYATWISLQRPEEVIAIRADAEFLKASLQTAKKKQYNVQYLQYLVDTTNFALWIVWWTILVGFRRRTNNHPGYILFLNSFTLVWGIFLRLADRGWKMPTVSESWLFSLT